MRFWAVLALVGLAVVPAMAADATTAAALRARALADPTAWDVLTSLTYDVGPRPVGSPAAARARDWAVAKLTAMGFTDVHVEPFAKPSWQRGAESVEMVAPYPLKLAMIGLGGTVPTPKGGITAEVAVVNTLSALKSAAPNAFKGKIVLVNAPMARAEDGAGYGPAVQIRYAASEAAKHGAVGYLIRSVSTGTGRAPHTGHTAYEGAKIPAAALGVPDADLIAYLAAKGPVKIRLSLSSKELPAAQAWTISGEIKGRTHPDEVVVIGGHIDSWDNCLCAVDDASGVATTIAAAKAIADLAVRPKRTIRVVLWGSEETGGASEAYVAAHKAELPKIVAASESDLGPWRIVKLFLPKGASANPAFKDAGDLLAPLHIVLANRPAEDAGADVEGLAGAGVPVFAFGQDAGPYFDYHHSADDTPNIVDKALLAQNVAAWAVMTYLIADSDADLRGK